MSVKRETLHIFDLVLKRLLRLSASSVIRFINGLFGKNHPLHSTVEYPNTENISRKLRGMERGMERGREEVARSLLERGMALLEVAEVADLPVTRL